MRRMIQWAVDNGFDRVAWLPGEVHAERYDLSKQISRVSLEDNSSGGIGRPQMEGPFTHGVLRAWDHNNRKVIDTHVRGADRLAALVGKDLADKLLGAEASEASSAGHGVRVRVRELSGLDLKVGGEGMKGFYDKILPAETQKIIGRFGGKVRQSEIETGDVSRYDLVNRGNGWRLVDRESEMGDYVGPVFRSGEDAEKWLADQGLLSQRVHSFDTTADLRRAASSEGMTLFQPPRMPRPPPGGMDLFGTQRAQPPAQDQGLHQQHQGCQPAKPSP
jgi:hypothetical protein